MATILDGKKLADQILIELKEEITKLNKKIGLGVILVGENPASAAYIERKKKVGEELGIDVKVYKYPEEITTKKLRHQIGVVCRAPNMEGVIVQLPLPEHINTQSILDTILHGKDVDVLGREQSGKFYINKFDILPPTAAGIMRLLEEYKIEIKGKNAVVLGYGRLVGKPVAHLLKQAGATITVLDENTKNPAEFIKQADIVISGVGKPGLITKDMVKAGAAVIDAGTSEQNGKLVGDVAEDVKDVAGYITPVPGGVGPITVAMLFWNLVELAKK